MQLAGRCISFVKLPSQSIVELTIFDGIQILLNEHTSHWNKPRLYMSEAQIKADDQRNVDDQRSIRSAIFRRPITQIEYTLELYQCIT